MKKLSYLFLVIFLIFFIIPKISKSQEDTLLFPPTCLYVDPISLEATWCEPLFTALDEDFEDPVFPPAAWQTIPVDGGWYRTDTSSGCQIPGWDSFYAMSCGTPSGNSNFLITPQLDLRGSEGYELTFDSFYDGSFGAIAYIEYSFDGGATWELYWQMNPDPGWTAMSIGLEPFSGPDGPEQIMFTFEAFDWGGWGALWAIDNIKIQVPYPPADYLDFYVYLDDTLSGITTNTNWNLAPLGYGEIHTACVKARYADGLSEEDCYDFTSNYLYPPDSLTAIAPDDAAILSWFPPSDTCCPPSGQLPLGLLGYNIYKDQEFLAYTPHDPPGVYTQQGFVEEGLYPPGWYEYTVTALYDLTSYGHPGDTAESVPDGPAVICNTYCFELDFSESWGVGTFEDNFWIKESDNWKISNSLGNPPPSAQFWWSPVQDNYSLALESNCLTALGMTEGKIWLDFDMKLNTPSPPSGSETMNVQVWNWDNESWSTVAVYNNGDGSFDWTPQHFEITTETMNSIFKVRFLAEGVHSGDIIAWNVDNIHIYRTCSAPYGLYSVVHPYGVALYWEGPDARDVFGCNVYRSIDGSDYELIDYAQEMPYIIENPAEGYLYCYKVTAIWESETDLCESDFSNEDCFTVGIESPVPEPDFTIYPIPATDHLYIFLEKTTSDREFFIYIYNSAGVIISQQKFTNDGRSLTVDLSGLAPGVYFIEVKGSSGFSGVARFTLL